MRSHHICGNMIRSRWPRLLRRFATSAKQAVSCLAFCIFLIVRCSKNMKIHTHMDIYIYIHTYFYICGILTKTYHNRVCIAHGSARLNSKTVDFTRQRRNGASRTGVPMLDRCGQPCNWRFSCSLYFSSRVIWLIDPILYEHPPQKKP